MKYWLSILAVALVSGSAGFQAKDWFSPAEQAEPCTTADVHKQINELRASLNLSPLEWDYRLAEDARRRNMQFLEGSPWGHDGWLSTEYVFTPYRKRGENLAKQISLCEVFSRWSASPKHYEVMTIKDYSLIGISGEGGYVTLHVAERLDQQ